MKLATLVGAALMSTSLFACDSLVTAQDRGDAVLNLKGQAVSQSPQTPAGYEVGVLFTRVVVPSSKDYPQPPERIKWTLETEIVKGTISGTFPAEFQVDLSAPSQVYSYDTSFQYGDNYGVFDPERTPVGVRIGNLVIGPAAEFDNLPRSILFDPLVRNQGDVLAPYLANTTITGYQVIYAEGVDSEDKIYPIEAMDGNGPSTTSGGLKINDGYTLVDTRTYMKSWIWIFCWLEQLEVARTLPAFTTCEADNAELIACMDSCGYSNPKTCDDACYASFPGQISRNTCNTQVAGPLTAAACGPENRPGVQDVSVLSGDTALSVTLGADDIKAGLLMTHMTQLD
jgi:hypothetical protein